MAHASVIADEFNNIYSRGFSTLGAFTYIQPSRLSDHALYIQKISDWASIVPALRKKVTTSNDGECSIIHNAMNRPEWCGFSNKTELASLIQNGDEELAYQFRNKSLKLTKTYFASADTQKMTRTKDIVGSTPSVPRALYGNPRSMFRTKNVRTSGNKLSLVYNATYRWTYSKEQVVDCGSRFFALCHVLEMLHIPFEIYMASISDERWNILTKLKDKGDFPHWREVDGGTILKLKDVPTPLNTARLAFACANPAFLRGLNFGLFQRMDGLDTVVHEVSDTLTPEVQVEKVANDSSMGTVISDEKAKSYVEKTKGLFSIENMAFFSAEDFEDIDDKTFAGMVNKLLAHV